MKKNFAAILFFAATIAAQSAWAEDKIADVTDMQALRAAGSAVDVIAVVRHNKKKAKWEPAAPGLGWEAYSKILGEDPVEFMRVVTKGKRNVIKRFIKQGGMTVMKSLWPASTSLPPGSPCPGSTRVTLSFCAA